MTWILEILTRRTASDKTLRDKAKRANKALTFLKVQNMMDINVDLLQWFMTFLIKKLLLPAKINLLATVVKMRISWPAISNRITQTIY